MKEVIIPKGLILLGSGFILESPSNYDRFRWYYNAQDWAMTETPITEEEYGKSSSDIPMTKVNFFDCIQWCNEQSVKDGYTPVYNIEGDNLIINEQADGWRLPTSSLWEYAAKGGPKTNYFLYAGSDNLDEVAWYSGNSDHMIHSVSKKKPNELGLYDMSGNVREITESSYSDFLIEKEMAEGNQFVAENKEFHNEAKRHLLIAFKKAEFIIGNYKVERKFFVSYLKTKYGSMRRIESEITRNDILPVLFTELIRNFFDEIPVFTVEQAFGESNLELRRIMLSCLDPAEVFQQIDMQKISTEVLKHPNHKWKETEQGIDAWVDNNFETVYELYSADPKKMGFENVEGRIAILKCWCPSTDREYMIPVPPEYLSKSPIDAVAWTAPCPYNKVKHILRQGDIYIYVPAKGATYLEEKRILTGDEYQKLLYSET